MEMLDDFFKAAMDSNNVWEEGKNGTAGNSIFVIEQIEMIIEATYLLHVKWKQNAGKMKNRKQDSEFVIPARLPLLLTEEEYRQPILVLQRFFEYLPLPAWKKLLRDFAINSLSRSSVTEAIEERHIFPFTKYLRKLVWAGFLLSIKR